MAHGLATEEKKGGEEEWKNPASLVIVNTTVQRACETAGKAGVSTKGSRIGLAKMGGGGGSLNQQLNSWLRRLESLGAACAGKAPSPTPVS